MATEPQPEYNPHMPPPTAPPPSAPEPYPPGQQQYLPPGQQYLPPGQQYAPPGQHFAPPVPQFAPPGQQFSPPVPQFAPPGQQYAPPPVPQYTSPGLQYPPPVVQHTSPGQQYPFPGQQAAMPSPQPAPPVQHINLTVQQFAAPVQQPDPNFGSYGPPPLPAPVCNAQPREIERSEVEPRQSQVKWISFDDIALRRKFIRKVYAILTSQLVFVLAVTAFFLFEENTRKFVKTNPEIDTGYTMFVICYLAMNCCGNLRRGFPANVILITLFTISLALLVGIFSVRYETYLIFCSITISAGICLAVVLLSFTPKYDFLSCCGLIILLAWACALTGFIGNFYQNTNTIWGGIISLVFLLYVVYGTRICVSKGRDELTPEEYVYGTIQIWTMLTSKCQCC